MSATSVVKKWDSPEKTRISGEPPGPNATISHTARGEVRRHDVRAINPYYKTDPSSIVPNGGAELRISRESKIEPKLYNGAPDYKIEKEQESYRLNIIDPTVTPRSGPGRTSNTLPAYSRKHTKSTDFPSSHSKRSFLKMAPLEPRKLRSLETKNITPKDYLSESLERHRALSMSPLRENLKVNERDVNQQWNAAPRPGPKAGNLIKESTFQKTTEESFTRGKNWSFGDRDLLNNVRVQHSKHQHQDVYEKCKNETENSLTPKCQRVNWKQPMTIVIDYDRKILKDASATIKKSTKSYSLCNEFQIYDDFGGSIISTERNIGDTDGRKYFDNNLLLRKNFFLNGILSLLKKSLPGYNKAEYKLMHNVSTVASHVSTDKYLPSIDVTVVVPEVDIVHQTCKNVAPNFSTTNKATTTHSKPGFMEPMSELQVGVGQQHHQHQHHYQRAADSAYSSQVTTAQRTPAQQHSHGRSKSAGPSPRKEILFEGRHPPSSYIGFYTQLDLPPQPVVAENRPVYPQIDARSGSGPSTDLVPKKVVHLRERYGNWDEKPIPTTNIILTTEERTASFGDSQRPPPHVADSSSWQHTTSNNFSPRSLISVNGADGHSNYHTIYSEHNRSVQQQQPPVWPFPAVLVPVANIAPSGTFSYEMKEEKKSNTEFERRPRYYEDDSGKHSTMIKEKQRRPQQEIVRQVIPRVAETTNTKEETKRTEEVERRVVKSEKKESKHKRAGGHNRSYVTHRVDKVERRPRHAEVDYAPEDSFFRESEFSTSRQGKLSDQRRRDDHHYSTEDRRRNRENVYKTHSSKDIYNADDHYGVGPIVEYPPTLPRSEDHYGERSIRRSNSMNDWSLQPRYYQDPSGLMARYDGGMTHLEREFRDSLLMPLPQGQNVNEREFREEKIPGGHESFSKDVKGHSGTRRGDNPNDVTHFSEAKQEFNFKREQTFDR